MDLIYGPIYKVFNCDDWFAEIQQMKKGLRFIYNT